MSKPRIKRFAIVQPIGKPPYRDRANLDYRDNAELSMQLVMYARGKWPMPQKVTVDIHTKQILVDGTARANYSLHEYRPTTGAGQ